MLLPAASASVCPLPATREFNAKTADFKDVPLRVLIKVYEDKSYDWILKGPPSSWYIKQAAGLARGADRPGHEAVATISLKHLYEIAQVGGGYRAVPVSHRQESWHCF